MREFGEGPGKICRSARLGCEGNESASAALGIEFGGPCLATSILRRCRSRSVAVGLWRRRSDRSQESAALRLCNRILAVRQATRGANPNGVHPDKLLLRQSQGWRRYSGGQHRLESE